MRNLIPYSSLCSRLIGKHFPLKNLANHSQQRSVEHPGRENAGWFLEHFTGEFKMVGGQLGNTHTKVRNLPVSNQEKGKTDLSFLLPTLIGSP